MICLDHIYLQELETQRSCRPWNQSGLWDLAVQVCNVKSHPSHPHSRVTPVKCQAGKHFALLCTFRFGTSYKYLYLYHRTFCATFWYLNENSVPFNHSLQELKKLAWSKRYIKVPFVYLFGYTRPFSVPFSNIFVQFWFCTCSETFLVPLAFAV